MVRRSLGLVAWFVQEGNSFSRVRARTRTWCNHAPNMAIRRIDRRRRRRRWWLASCTFARNIHQRQLVERAG
uniref:Putative secreted protein n=1 Tax=Anopheles marajoara TaxID=58244 RepID=A0A2M4CE39_9DIPT